MKYFLTETTELDSPFMQELLSEFQKGLYFHERLKVIMAAHFDIWNPGCYCFLVNNFYAEFYPQIKASATIRKILDFYHDRIEVYSMITGKRIYIYAPKFAEKADRYTKWKLAKSERDNEKPPPDAKSLRIFCTTYLPKREKDIEKLGIKFDVNKRIKPRKLFTSVYR